MWFKWPRKNNFASTKFIYTNVFCVFWNKSMNIVDFIRQYWSKTNAKIVNGRYVFYITNKHLLVSTKLFLSTSMRGWNVHGLWHGLWVTWPWLNSLWPSDAIRRQRSGSTLAQVMACCLTAPSHYLNQCWLIIIWSQVTFIVGQFHKRCLNHQSLKSIWKVHIWNYIQISQGPMCKNLALNPTGSKKMMQFTIPTIFLVSIA